MNGATQLSRATHLDIIKAAFEAKTLQMFNAEQCRGGRACSYSGPCAIGVIFSKDDRLLLDVMNYPIEMLVSTGTVIFPEGEYDWWHTLQNYHDAAVCAFNSQLNNCFGWEVGMNYEACVERFRAHLYAEVV